MALSADFYKPQLLVGKGYGAPSSPAKVFELLSGDAYTEARRQGQAPGIMRLGPRSLGDTSPDVRPFILEPLIAASTVTDSNFWTNTRGDSSNANPLFFGTSNRQFGGGKSISFVNPAFPNTWEFSSSLAVLGGNEAFGIRADVSDVSNATGAGNATGHVVYLGWGSPGRGWLFQIRDGSPEILHLSPAWNETDETALHLLYQLPDSSDNPSDPILTPADIAEIHRLEKLLYDMSESLSFEGGLGRDEWRGAGWTLFVIPEPRGVNQLPSGLVERGFYDPLTNYVTGNIVVFANTRWAATDSSLGKEPGSFISEGGTVVVAPWQQLRASANTGKSGAVHFLLEGGAGAKIDLNDYDFLDAQGIPHPPTGDLWRNTSFRVGATGGAVGWQILKVAFPETGTLEWGWYGSDSDTTTWPDLQTTIDATGPGKDENGNYYTSATLEKVDDTRLDENGDQLDLPSLRFKLRATLGTVNSKYSPIIHAISARRPNGVRTGWTDYATLFDSLALPHDDQPVMNMRFRVDETGARSVVFTFREVNGKTRETRTLGDFVGHQSSLRLGGAPWITSGTIPNGRDNDLRQLAEQDEAGNVISRSGYATAKGETNFELTLDDGHWVDNDLLCSPSLILDGLFLGEAMRRLEGAAGRHPSEYSLIPSAIGPRIAERGPGENYCYVVESGTSIDGARQGLLDRYGFGLRYYKNHNGVAVLEKPPTAIRFDAVEGKPFSFTSDGSKNDPDLIRGGTRHIILNSLVWQIDLDCYETIFTVQGGSKGRPITKRFENKAALKLLPGNIAGPRFRGAHKEHAILVDEGLKDAAAVNYALLSLQWRYGRPGRIAQIHSLLHPNLLPWDRFKADGVLSEVRSWSGEIPGKGQERMDIQLREVV